MSQMKVLVTGSNGQLGRAVQERFKDEALVCTDVDELDITNLDDVHKFVKSVNPDVIINCAAYTAVDKAEDDYDRAYAINCIGPQNLAMAANTHQCKLVHISTDYVFGGNLSLDDIYREDDEKDPQTVYGLTKYKGENEIKQFTTRYYIFRTAWLFGDGPNFVRTMLKLGWDKDEVRVVIDQYGSPTYAVDLADIIYQALQKKIPMGTYHTTNLGYTNWYEFCKEIYNIAGIKCKVIPVTSEEFIRPAKRPKNSMLDKGKILNEGVKIPIWQDALERYLKVELKSEE